MQEAADTAAPEVRRAIDRACWSSLANAEGRLCTDHLLVGLAQEPSSRLSRVFADRAIDMSQLLDALDQRLCSDVHATDSGGDVAYTREASAALTLAAMLAGEDLVSVADFSLACVSDGSGCAGRLLRRVEVSGAELWREWSAGVTVRTGVAIDRRWLDRPACDAHHSVRRGNLLARAAVLADAPELQTSIDAETIRWQGWTEASAEALRAQMPATLVALDETISHFSWCGLRLSIITDERRFVGAYQFGDVEIESRSATLGWWHTGAERGNGHGRDALAAALEYGHAHLGLQQIRMGTNTKNVRVLRQIAPSGATHLGRTDHRLPNGEVVESDWFTHQHDGL